MVSTRKRLILHIGFHQAGSAAVHESLYAARVGLRDQGVVYPQPLSGHPSHLDLATALGFNPRDELGHYDRSSLVERYRRLIDDAAPGSAIVIASEEFCLGNFLPEAMENLRFFREKLDVSLTVSAGVRDPLPFLVDVYQTELRNTDLGLDFTQWLNGFDLTGADFDNRLEVWRSLIGPSDDLVVHDVEQRDGRAMNRIALDGALADCGLDESDVPLIQPPGVALHPRLVEPLVAVRRHVGEQSERQRLLEALLDISPLLEPVDDGAALHLEPEARAALEARLGVGSARPTLEQPTETSRSADTPDSPRPNEGQDQRQP